MADVSDAPVPAPARAAGPRKWLPWLIVGGVLLLLVLWMASSYNKLVNSREQVNTKWGAVQSDYQRRADLIPNLVETVKGSANFEQSTLTAVINARAKATQVQVNPNNPQDLQKFQAAQGELGGALSRLLVTVEAYPQLQSTQAFRDLQVQLEGTENRIAVSRKDFNDAARAYNTQRQRFPTILVANVLGFQSRPYFEADQGAQTAPKVQFSPTPPPAGGSTPVPAPSPAQ
jgi:LemA protein